MCSHCDGHPDEEKFVREFNERREAEAKQLDLQGWLEVAYARLMLNSTRNLIGHIQGSSPWVGKRRVA